MPNSFHEEIELIVLKASKRNIDLLMFASDILRRKVKASNKIAQEASAKIFIKAHKKKFDKGLFMEGVNGFPNLIQARLSNDFETIPSMINRTIEFVKTSKCYDEEFKKPHGGRR